MFDFFQSFLSKPNNTMLTGIIVGVIITTLFFFLKKIMQKFNKIILRFFSWIYKYIIISWLPSPIAYSRYKRRILKSDLAKLENPVGPSLKIPLEQSYAPLKLISEHNKQDDLELFNYVNSNKKKRFIVLGGAGTGKTTLMKSLIINIINKTTSSKIDNLIPVFISLRELASKKHSIEQAIISSFDDYDFPKAEKFIKANAKQGNLLIILDGLDEVGIKRQAVVSNIMDFCKKDEIQEHKNFIIVTCREYSYKQKQELRNQIPDMVSLEPFTNHHMRIFLKGWPKHNNYALNLFADIQKNDEVRDICRNPLMLTILTGLYMQTKDFSIPKTRKDFYKEAIDELLIKRPGRKRTKQKFSKKNKEKILRKVCLKTIKDKTDSEALSSKDMEKYAKDLLWGDKSFNIDLFLEELQNINGIIKPCGHDDDKFTCAHRTIQEYFAAWEAHINYDKKQVIEEFSSRDDLIKVLYFYCSMIHNTKDASYILKQLINKNKYIEAGECLLNMTVVPDKINLINDIGEFLKKEILEKTQIHVELELLSSISLKNDKAFIKIKHDFQECMDKIELNDEKASALEYVLSTSPSIAMKLIPGFLENASNKWKKTGIKLLKNISTDEGLDTLIKLLKNKNKLIRTQAAKVLADLIKTRNKDLIERKELLKEQTDLEIWPLENFFPGQIAIPIAKALKNETTNNNAINYAAKAIKAKQSNNSEDYVFLKKWKKLKTHFKIKKLMKNTAKGFRLYSFISTILIILTLLFMNLYSWKNNCVILINISPLKIETQTNKPIKELIKNADIITSYIKTKYTKEIKGVFKILPWNWNVKPDISNDSFNIYNKLKIYLFQNLTPKKIENDLKNIKSLKKYVKKSDFNNFQNAVNQYKSAFTYNKKNIIFLNYNFFHLFFGFIFIFIILFLLYIILTEDLNFTATIPVAITFAAALAIAIAAAVIAIAASAFIIIAFAAAIAFVIIAAAFVAVPILLKNFVITFNISIEKILFLFFALTLLIPAIFFLRINEIILSYITINILVPLIIISIPLYLNFPKNSYETVVKDIGRKDLLKKYKLSFERY